MENWGETKQKVWTSLQIRGTRLPQKAPKSDFQSEFSMSNIIQIFFNEESEFRSTFVRMIFL
jgi:hypothetical protein